VASLYTNGEDADARIGADGLDARWQHAAADSSGPFAEADSQISTTRDGKSESSSKLDPASPGATAPIDRCMTGVAGGFASTLRWSVYWYFDRRTI
jgi:hypothetical protein